MSVKYQIHEISFENQGDYLDVTIHTEGYLELKIETTESFTITDQKDLDEIYKKLSEALKTVNPKKK
jgi:hypothetical protein